MRLVLLLQLHHPLAQFPAAPLVLQPLQQVPEHHQEGLAVQAYLVSSSSSRRCQVVVVHPLEYLASQRLLHQPLASQQAQQRLLVLPLRLGSLMPQLQALDRQPPSVGVPHHLLLAVALQPSVVVPPRLLLAALLLGGLLPLLALALAEGSVLWQEPLAGHLVLRHSALQATRHLGQQQDSSSSSSSSNSACGVARGGDKATLCCCS
jgi:hypothetical protein